jgi:vacuolar-type H+-ATPase subunit E/Vma4
VTQEAARRAEQILVQARGEAESIRADADDYAMNSLAQLQDELERITNQVSNGILLLKDEQSKRTAVSTSASQLTNK